MRYNLINSIHNFISQSEFSYKITYLLVTSLLVTLFFFCHPIQGSTTLTPLRKYIYPLLVLEILYLIFIVYVIITYISFYLLSSSSTALIQISTALFHVVWMSLLWPYLTLAIFSIPISESLLWGAALLFKFRGGFV